MRFLILLLLTPTILFSQPKIDQAGDNWSGRVEEAIRLVQSVDPVSYKTIITHCDRVSFWMGGFSSNTIMENQERVILIATEDMKIGSVNNIAAALVHESVHLWVLDYQVGIDPDSEELLCYTLELEFLKKVPNVEPFLLTHAQSQLNKYKNKIKHK